MVLPIEVLRQLPKLDPANKSHIYSRPRKHFARKMWSGMIADVNELNIIEIRAIKSNGPVSSL